MKVKNKNTQNDLNGLLHHLQIYIYVLHFYKMSGIDHKLFRNLMIWALLSIVKTPLSEAWASSM